MGTTTGIEWTDSTWSPIRARVRADAAEVARALGYASLVPIAEKMAGRVGQHCEHVSPGCENCYAERMQHRCLPGNGTGLPYDRRSRDLVEAFVDEKALGQPLGWRTIHKVCVWCEDGGTRVAGKPDGCSCERRPRRIFVENQSDLFGEWVTDEMLDRIFAVMALCPQHTFQVLTKRPERMLKYMRGMEGHPAERIEEALAQMEIDDEAGCAVANYINGWSRWRELPDDGNPLNGTMRRWPLPNAQLGVSMEDQPTADKSIPLLLQTPAAVRFVSAEPLLGRLDLFEGASGIDWVICGGESGTNARPMHPDWARNLRDQCVDADVPFFFKQWGEWWPNSQANYMINTELEELVSDEDGPFSRVGKKAAGSLLDGAQWKEFPETTR